MVKKYAVVGLLLFLPISSFSAKPCGILLKNLYKHSGLDELYNSVIRRESQRIMDRVVELSIYPALLPIKVADIVVQGVKNGHIAQIPLQFLKRDGIITGGMALLYFTSSLTANFLPPDDDRAKEMIDVLKNTEHAVVIVDTFLGDPTFREKIANKNIGEDFVEQHLSASHVDQGRVVLVKMKSPKDLSLEFVAKKATEKLKDKKIGYLTIMGHGNCAIDSIVNRAGEPSSLKASMADNPTLWITGCSAGESDVWMDLIYRNFLDSKGKIVAAWTLTRHRKSNTAEFGNKILTTPTVISVFAEIFSDVEEKEFPEIAEKWKTLLEEGPIRIYEGK